MPRGSNLKRERQYEHIEGSAARAEQIVARTVNKQRGRGDEAETAGIGSTRGSWSAGHCRRRSHGCSDGSGSSRSRRSQRSRGSGQTRRELSGRTLCELSGRSRRRDIRGRSSFDEARPERALSPATG